MGVFSAAERKRKRRNTGAFAKDKSTGFPAHIGTANDTFTNMRLYHSGAALGFVYASGAVCC